MVNIKASICLEMRGDYYYSPEIMAFITESTYGDNAATDGEAIVLLQAIYSIKAIIGKDPSSNEKVIIWQILLLCLV